MRFDMIFDSDVDFFLSYGWCSRWLKQKKAFVLNRLCKEAVFMYTISKVISQSFVCATTNKNQKVILKGNKIGITKDLKDISNVYEFDTPSYLDKMIEVIKTIPNEYIETCDKVRQYAKEKYDIDIGTNLYIFLPEHMHFAIERQKQEIVYENTVVDIVEKYYSEYFDMAVYGSKILKDTTNISISRDEIGFISLHLLNVSFNSDMSELVEMLNFIRSTMDILKNYDTNVSDNNREEVKKLEVYIKELAKKLFTSHKLRLDLDKKVNVGNIWSKEYRFAKKICNMVKDEYGKELTKGEIYNLYRCLVCVSQMKSA